MDTSSSFQLVRPRDITLLLAVAASFVPTLVRADSPPPNDGQRYVSVGAQADDRHDREWLSTLSLPVGQHAWVHAGGGQSHSQDATGRRSPSIVTGGVGVAGRSVQLTVDASHRSAAGTYRQTDVGASLEAHHPDGHALGVDVSHRSAWAAGTATVAGGVGGPTPVPVQSRVSGHGAGVHGTLQATGRVSLYGAIARNRYHGTVQQTSTPGSGGPLGLFGPGSLVTTEELALDHSATVGATYRRDHVAVSAEASSGRVYQTGAAVHGVALKGAVDVAPGWRLVPAVGRASTGNAGSATFASLAATYGW